MSLTLEEQREWQALQDQIPVAYMYIDSSGKYSTPMLELKNTVSGYHECWKPYPLYSSPVPASEELELLATCECGDGFTLHGRGECINCVAAKTVPASEWQPIESAPKDGRDILIYDDGTKIGSWSEDSHPWNHGNWWIEGGQVTASNATYWMPLPESPKGRT